MTFNDIIRASMADTSNADLIRECCCKIGVRKYVMRTLGAPYVVPVMHRADRFDDLPIDKIALPCAVKCTHDSGSTHLVRMAGQWDRARRDLTRRLGKVYGVEKGEWGYAHVKPCVIVEPYLGPVGDWKIHCRRGEPRFVQYIYGRDTRDGPYEAYGTPAGKEIPGRWLDHKFQRGRWPGVLPKCFDEMIAVAATAAKPFDYVRVDMYATGAQPLVGEITFWPRAGRYETPHNAYFGELLA